MGMIDANNAIGHVVKMVRTNPGHLDSKGRKGFPIEENNPGFANLVSEAIGRVSDRQMNVDQLFERMITHPDEVEPHDITIAMAQAELSLNLTKTIVDRAVKAYNDITAMR